jgi:hypothetical protein
LKSWKVLAGGPEASLVPNKDRFFKGLHDIGTVLLRLLSDSNSKMLENGNS